jgi:hypothetical protein
MDTNVLNAFGNFSFSTLLCKSGKVNLQRMVVPVLEACGLTYTLHTDFQSLIKN